MTSKFLRHIACEHCGSKDASLAEQPAPVASPHEQEPVAWICHQLNKVKSLWWDKNQAVHLNAGFEFTPLYTSPPTLSLAQRKPLTDEQIKGIYEDCDAPTGGEFTIAFTRAIEAAHGIKENT